MSDAKLPPAVSPTPEEPVLRDPLVGTRTTKPGVPPAMAMGMVIIALLGVIVLLLLSRGVFNSKPSDPDLSNLKAEVDARRAELNRQRQSMGLSPVEGDSEPIENIAKRLKKDSDSLVALAGRYQQMLSEKDSELSARNAEVIRSEKLRQSLSAEASRIQSELQRALVGGSDADMLRRDMVALKSQRDALSTELALARQDLKDASKAVSQDDFADLKRRFDETLRAKEFFEARVKELQGDLSKARLFASSESELVPAAVELFRSLRKLEGSKDSDITTLYSSLGVELGANVVHTLNFATGSAGLAAADEEVIRNLTADLPDGDLLFVVGYASKTGNVDANQTLSSDRATSVAEFYSGLKRPGQLVQAVYLGQTDRFSSRIPERNQIVEIWRIRKK